MQNTVIVKTTTLFIGTVATLVVGYLFGSARTKEKILLEQLQKEKEAKENKEV